jgi:y4mF family transcriptional regulator
MIPERVYNLLKILNCTRSGFFCLKTLKLYPNGSIMIDMNKIGNYIKEERKKAGLTQEEFAMRSGLGLRFVRELEQGKETVRMDKVNQALAMFGKEAVPGEKEE